MLRYPAKLEREGTRVLVFFPDVPGVHTFGGAEKSTIQPTKPLRSGQVIREPVLT